MIRVPTGWKLVTHRRGGLLLCTGPDLELEFCIWLVGTVGGWRYLNAWAAATAFSLYDVLEPPMAGAWRDFE